MREPDIRDMTPMQQAQASAMDAVRREREKQDEKWGTIDKRSHELTYGDWLHILMEEVGEFSEAFLNYKFGGELDEDDMLDEAIQVAAVGVAIVEAIIYQEIILEDKDE